MKPPKIIGITGGIGSGKSTVSKFFLEWGIPVYNSDSRAKILMNEFEDIKAKIIHEFGEDSYQENQLNRTYLASQIFNNPNRLKILNQLVHPAVFKDFKDWIAQQKAPFVLKEAAILFESGSYQDCDWIVSIIADEKTRIKRVVERDGYDEEKVKERMKNQWSDEQRIEHSDFVIENNQTKKELKEKSKALCHELLKKSKRIR